MMNNEGYSFSPIRDLKVSSRRSLKNGIFSTKAYGYTTQKCWNSLSFLFLMFVLMIFTAKCIATDTLTQSQGISVGQTLISSGQMFELGFFSPGNSSKQYIGIWYRNISTQKIVWVANRENPVSIADTASTLTIGRDGNLRLLDGMKNTVWSTNVSSQPNTTIAVLLDNGDFTLYDNVSKLTLWESFNYPSDTFISGMSIGINHKTGERHFLSSWQTEDNPSSGIFLCGLTTETPPQNFVWKSSKPYWRSGPWDGWKFIGTPNTGIGYSNGIIVTPDNQEGSVYLTYSSPSLSHVAIVYLTPDGNLKRSHWDIGTQQGGDRWQSIVVPCDVYGTCGPFGVCNRDGSQACECLKGFVPKSMEEWTKGNWERGCVRRTELVCEKNASTLASNKAEKDGFFKLSLMKLPDHYLYLYNIDSIGCQQWCSNNCSCKAYAFPAGIGCMVWVGDLVDTQQFSSGGTDLFLHLAHSELEEKKKSMKLIISLTIVSGVILLGVFIFGVHRRKANQRVKRKYHIKEFNSADIEGTPSGSPLVSGHHVTQAESSDLPMFDFNTLAVATNSFSETNKLGAGGFGPVYKGKLEDGKEIAVKRLSTHSGQGAVEFKNEILLISKLQHRNLVRLLGYCIKGDEKLLIYEYLKNKSLDTLLFGKDIKSKVQLDWAKRFNIIHGIARGLLYLHRDSRLRIIHRDLKASNILLDDNMDPKISDFGLARAFEITQELANTQRVVGTFGYISPEYAMGGLFSEKSDVYSFGVLLLEIISGMRNTSFYSDEKYNLLGYAWHLWKEGRELELMDQTLSDSCSSAEFVQYMRIGLLCVQDHTADRPTMSVVLLMLTSEVDLPQPKPPTFYQSLLSSDLLSQSNSTGPLNKVSTSVAEGR